MDETSLAKKIFNEQKRLNFPGLVKECTEFAEELKIKNELEKKLPVDNSKVLSKTN